MNDNNNNLRSILMLPWLAHGHISPFLELSKRLSNRGITIYFCSTPVNLISIKQRLAWTNYLSRIHLVELCLPDTPGLPPHLHTTKHLPPSLVPTLTAAFDLSAPAFAHILSRLRPDLVIYDLLQPWAPAVALSRGIPSVLFHSSSAAMSAYSWRLFQMNNLLGVDDESPPFPELYLRDHERPAFVQMFEGTSNGIKGGERLQWCDERSAGVILIKSFRDIEAKYIDDLSLRIGKKVVPVGALVEEDHRHEHNQGDDIGKRNRIIEWLDKRSKRSTVFVSFGSEYLLTPQERTEIALGLEQSEVNFTWAIRLCRGAGDIEATDDHSLADALPEGFLERVKGRGYVTQDWAPQAAILSHPSTGGFLSHCGWGSVMEAMRFGVPIIAMPIHLDQPINARLVAEGVGVGVEVERDRDGKVRQEEVARTVRNVMVDEGGERVRRRARELMEAMEMRREMRLEDEDIDRAVDELLRVCGKTKESIEAKGGGGDYEQTSHSNANSVNPLLTVNIHADAHE